MSQILTLAAAIALADRAFGKARQAPDGEEKRGDAGSDGRQAEMVRLLQQMGKIDKGKIAHLQAQLLQDLRVSKILYGRIFRP